MIYALESPVTMMVCIFLIVVFFWLGLVSGRFQRTLTRLVFLGHPERFGYVFKAYNISSLWENHTTALYACTMYAHAWKLLKETRSLEEVRIAIHATYVNYQAQEGYGPGIVYPLKAHWVGHWLMDVDSFIHRLDKTARFVSDFRSMKSTLEVAA